MHQFDLKTQFFAREAQNAQCFPNAPTRPSVESSELGFLGFLGSLGPFAVFSSQKGRATLAAVSRLDGGWMVVGW